MRPTALRAQTWIFGYNRREAVAHCVLPTIRQTILRLIFRPMAVRSFFALNATGAVFISSRRWVGRRALLLRTAGVPAFRPTGLRLHTGPEQWRGYPDSGFSGVFVIPLAGGAPLRIVPAFTMARDPVWAPDGHSLLFWEDETATRPCRRASTGGGFHWMAGLRSRRDCSRALPLNGAEPSPDSWTKSGVIFHLSDSIWRVPVARRANHRAATALGFHRRRYSNHLC